MYPPKMFDFTPKNYQCHRFNIIVALSGRKKSSSYQKLMGMILFKLLHCPKTNEAPKFFLTALLWCFCACFEAPELCEFRSCYGNCYIAGSGGNCVGLCVNKTVLTPKNYARKPPKLNPLLSNTFPNVFINGNDRYQNGIFGDHWLAKRLIEVATPVVTTFEVVFIWGGNIECERGGRDSLLWLATTFRNVCEYCMCEWHKRRRDGRANVWRRIFKWSLV